MNMVKEKVFVLLEGHGSQIKLADAIGVSKATISAWKTANSDGEIGAETAKGIARFFNIPLQILVDDNIRLVKKWSHDDYYDDFRKGDDSDKLKMFKSWGIPRDLINEYVELSGMDNENDEVVVLSDDERELVKLYRESSERTRGMAVGVLISGGKSVDKADDIKRQLDEAISAPSSLVD